MKPVIVAACQGLSVVHCFLAMRVLYKGKTLASRVSKPENWSIGTVFKVTEWTGFLFGHIRREPRATHGGTG